MNHKPAEQTLEFLISCAIVVGCAAHNQSSGPTGDPDADRLIAKTNERQRESQLAEDKATFCNNPPWQDKDLQRAEEEASQPPSPRSSPSDAYVQFAQWHESWREFDEKSCDTEDKWQRRRFNTIWEALQTQERGRPAAQHAFAIQTEEREMYTEFQATVDVERERLRIESAKKLGLRDVQVGLEDFLKKVQAEGIPMAVAKKTAIRLSEADDVFKVLQVLGGTALVTHGDLRVFVTPKSKDRIYENTPLRALGALTYKVAGVRSYQSLTGPQQAFVLQPVPDLEPSDQAVLNSLLSSYTRKPWVSFAQFTDGTLVECTDILMEKITSVFAKARAENVVLLKNPCKEQFVRSPIATCTVETKLSWRLFSKDTRLQVLTPQDCVALGGEWRGPRAAR